MACGGNKIKAGNARAVADGLTHSTNTLTQKYKMYLTVLYVFGSHAAPADTARDEEYATMLANQGQQERPQARM